jgi:hypothetical protein
LEKSDDDGGINRDWATIGENNTNSAEESIYELKKHKPWFDERCSKLLDQRKQAKLQWLQDPSEINRDNLKHINREASRNFRKKSGNIWQTKLMSLQRTVSTCI